MRTCRFDFSPALRAGLFQPYLSKLASGSAIDGELRANLGRAGNPCWLALSVHLHHFQGAAPPSTLSSRPKRSAAEGSAVCVGGETEPGDNSPTAHSLSPKVQLQIPLLRCASVGMTKSRAALHLGSGGGGWTEPAQQQPPGFVCPRSLQRIQQVPPSRRPAPSLTRTAPTISPFLRNSICKWSSHADSKAPGVLLSSPL